MSCVIHAKKLVILQKRPGEHYRYQVYIKRKLFIPKENQCCHKHILVKRFYQNDINNMTMYSNKIIIEVDKLKMLIEQMSIRCDSSINDRVGEYTLSEERVQVFTDIFFINL